MYYRHTLLFLFILFLSGCTLTIEPPQTEALIDNPIVDTVADPLDLKLRTIIQQFTLTGDPAEGVERVDVDEPLAQLGKDLFFTKALSGDMDVACATCHVPTLGGGDGLSLPIGVGAMDSDLVGPGRLHEEGEPNVPRNSPTTFNVALWKQVLFWDGRVERVGCTVDATGTRSDCTGIRTPDTVFGIPDMRAGIDLVMAQSRFPITSREEMRGFEFETSNNHDDIRKHLAARLGRYGIGKHELPPTSDWINRFSAVFGEATPEELITEQRIALALATYQRSQVFVENPWRAYVTGNHQAISADAKAGALLFFESSEAGGANCASCHAGDFFTDERFHVLAVPQVGPGKEGEYDPFADYGRFRETKHRDDLYAFRTPSLLNVEVTAPYGHSGAYATLEAMIRHHLNPMDSVDSYDYSQLAPDVQQEHMAEKTEAALMQLEMQRTNGLLTVEDMTLTDQEVGQLVAFLETLTDPCVKDAACLTPWMPNQEDQDPDGLRLLVVSLLE